MNNTYTKTLTLSSSSITGTDVVNPQGENLGHIEDLMIDLDTGRISYAVLSFGGIFGIGNKLFAVPLESLTINTEDENFVMDIDKERLEDAPGFDKDNWPETNNNTFRTEVYTYYNVEPYWDALPVRH
jgi:sporulation protein YlmC with PRC-barrel domain